MINITEIHKTRMLTLAECDELLNERRKLGGDLHPDMIKAEQEKYFKSIEHLKNK
jgi:hypothetical protein